MTEHVVGSSPRRVTMILFIALVTDMLAFTCILPLFPSIVTYYGNQTTRDHLYDSIVSALNDFQEFVGSPPNERYHNAFFGGLLGSLFSALQFISSPTLGALSDHFGRRTMMILSSFGTLLSYFIWLRAETFSLFVLSRVIGGLSKANINVATAIVSDVFPSSDRQKGMAMIGMSYSVGFLIGPMIGAYFSTIATTDHLFTAPAYFSIVLSIIHLFIVIFALPETLQHQQEKSKKSIEWSKAGQLIKPNDLFKFSAVNAPEEKKQEMQRFGNVYFIYLFLYAGLEFTLPFLTHVRFQFGSMQQGKLYLFTGLLMLPIQGYFVRKTPMERQKRMAEVGIMCIIPAFLLCAVAYNVYVLYMGLFLYAIASATVVTSLTCCVSAVHNSTDNGALSGVFRSIGALSRALGPAVAASVFWLFGPSVCYTLGALLLFTPLIMLRNTKNPVKLD